MRMGQDGRLPVAKVRMWGEPRGQAQAASSGLPRQQGRDGRARAEAAVPESPACLSETSRQEPQRGRPPGNLSAASQGDSDLSCILPELTLTPAPLLPKCPHHAVGECKPIRVGDNLHEDVHGIQDICQGVVFAIFTDNL